MDKKSKIIEKLKTARPSSGFNTVSVSSTR